MLVAENEWAQLFFRPGRSDYTLVTFNERGMVADGQTFWAQALADRLDVNCFGIVSKGPNWFPFEPTGQLLSLVKSDVPVVTYGHSMGGYGAIKFSRVLNADVALAFCPQYSISPNDNDGQDRRYAAYYRDKLHRSMRISPMDVGGRIFLFLDSRSRLDLLNARNISRLHPVSIVDVPYTNHSTVRACASATVFSQLMELVLQDSPSGLKKLLKASSRTTDTYYLNLAKALFERKHGRAANDCFEKHKSLATTRNRSSVMLEFRLHMAAGNIDAAGETAKHMLTRWSARPESYCHYALWQMAAERWQDAQITLGYVEARWPGFEHARTIMARLRRKIPDRGDLLGRDRASLSPEDDD